MRYEADVEGFQPVVFRREIAITKEQEKTNNEQGIQLSKP
jgi:hypothetical protein